MLTYPRVQKEGMIIFTVSGLVSVVFLNVMSSPQVLQWILLLPTLVFPRRTHLRGTLPRVTHHQPQVTHTLLEDMYVPYLILKPHAISVN